MAASSFYVLNSCLMDPPPAIVRVGFNAHSDAVQHGYRLLSTEPLFSMRMDYGMPFTSTICIPLDPRELTDSSPDYIKTIPGCKALSMLYYGGYDEPSKLTDGIEKL